ncbi:MAG: fructose PTS transporter subunit IIA [Tetragenococcus koreensis]|nr:fructose PTS transporter subunit IIA [Tetragenococcus koreensis]
MRSIIDKECIQLEMEDICKDTIIKKMAQCFVDTNRVSDLDSFIQNVYERERTEPTSIGSGIGMPHGRTDCVKTPSVSIARLSDPIIWNEETAEEVTLVIMIAVPKEDSSNHLKIISQLARNLMHEEFVNSVRQGDQTTIFNLMNNILN